MAKIPRAYPKLADKINELIAQGFKIYADINENTGRIQRIYGEMLNKKEYKKEKKLKKKLWS